VGYCVHQDGRAGGQDQWFLELKFRQKFKKKKNPDVKIM
jgi:hypothetical protein